MSVVTFLFGNGFDLACGLKSRYIDTYDGYIASESKTVDIRRFKKTIEKDIQSWADFEMRIIKYAQELNDEKILVECLNDYKEYLNMHLSNEQEKMHRLLLGNTVIIKAIREEMWNSLLYPEKSLIPNDKRMVVSAMNDGGARYYKYINFNYTNVLDSILEKSFIDTDVLSRYQVYNSRFPVLHIHGTLNNNLVLGIDNSDQLKDIPYLLSDRYKRKIVKPFFNNSYDNTRESVAYSYIDSSDVICVFGMSLGDSDLTWKKKLAEWLKAEPNHQLIFWDYNMSCKRYSPAAITEKMDDEEDYKIKFIESKLRVDGKSDLFKQMMRQIHIPVGDSPFDIERVAKKAEYEYRIKKEANQNRPKENGIG